MNKIYSLPILISAFFLTPTLSHAGNILSISDLDEASIQRLLTQPIERLLEQDITISSKTSESLLSAHSVVNVITADDIYRYGGKNLFDILSQLPGVTINRGIALSLSDNGLNMRGQVPSGNDTHTLILLNGRPVRESQSGGWTQIFYRTFPIESIEKIEVIRGPGSVLYGTNAFSGALNIITKKAMPEAETSISAGYGSFNSKYSQASFRKQYNEDFSMTAGLKLHDRDGWEFSARDLTNTQSSENLRQNYYGATLSTQYKNLTLNGFSAYTNLRIMGLVPLWPGGTHKQRRDFLDVGYAHQFDNGWKANLNVTYNGFANFAAESDGSLIDLNRFNDMLYEVSLAKNLTESTHFLTGFTYENRRGSLKAGGGEFKKYTNGSYYQLRYQAHEKVSLLGGLQINKVEDLNYDFSPRLGLVYKISDKFTSKINYGEAFRAPNASELQLQIPGAIGNPDLKSEKIATIDAQVIYNTPTLYGALTYYRSIVNDFIEFGPNPDLASPFPFTLSNGERLEYDGIEVEANWYPFQHWEFKGSSSYQWGQNPKTGDNDITLTPHYMLKTGVSYRPENGLTVSLFNQYFSEVIKNTGANIVNPKVDGYSYLTGNINVDLNQALNLKTSPQITWSLYGENLLDEKFYVPELSGSINSLPGSGGRAFYTNILFKF